MSKINIRKLIATLFIFNLIIFLPKSTQTSMTENSNVKIIDVLEGFSLNDNVFHSYVSVLRFNESIGLFINPSGFISSLGSVEKKPIIFFSALIELINASYESVYKPSKWKFPYNSFWIDEPIDDNNWEFCIDGRDYECWLKGDEINLSKSRNEIMTTTFIDPDYLVS